MAHDTYKGEATSAQEVYDLRHPRTSDPFTVKDSGERKQFASGMVRDTAADKIGWHRVLDGPMLRRWAVHLTKGAKKYPDVKPGVANWTLAAGEEEYQRFKESALRHFMDWYLGVRDEDHGAAVFFNINGAEYVLEKMQKPALSGEPGSVLDAQRALRGPGGV